MDTYRELLDLKDKRMDLMEETDKLLERSRSDRSLLQEVDDNSQRITALDRQILSLERSHQQEIAKAARVFNGSSVAHRRTDNDRSTIFADCLRSIKFGAKANGIPEEIRDLTTSGSSAIIQNPDIIDEVIHSLQSNNELAEAGVLFQQVDENYRSYPKVLTGPSHEWQENEGDQISLDTSLDIGSVKWSLKTVACRVSVSQQVLLDSQERARRIIQEEVRRQLQGAIAQACLTGTGSTGQPTGVENFSGLQTVDASSTQLTDWSEIIEACQKLAAVDCPISNISAFFSPTAWAQLADFTDTTGQPLRTPPLLEPVRFFNPTTHVLETYDTNSNTKMFLGDWSKLVVAIQGPISIVTEHLRADRLMVDFIVFMRMDVQALHENHFVQIDNISLT